MKINKPRCLEEGKREFKILSGLVSSAPPGTTGKRIYFVSSNVAFNPLVFQAAAGWGVRGAVQRSCRRVQRGKGCVCLAQSAHASPSCRMVRHQASKEQVPHMEPVVLMPPKSHAERAILAQLKQMELYGADSRGGMTRPA